MQGLAATAPETCAGPTTSAAGQAADRSIAQRTPSVAPFAGSDHGLGSPKSPGASTSTADAGFFYRFFFSFLLCSE